MRPLHILKPLILVSIILLIACHDSSSSRSAPSGAPGGNNGDETGNEAPELGPLIAGTGSWVAGTYVWTDYVYDDHGANTDGSPGGDGAGGYPETLLNTADFVQVQVGLGNDGWYVQAILQTLLDVDVPVLGFAIDTDADPATGSETLPGESWTPESPLGIELLIVQRGEQATIMAYDNNWTTIDTLPVEVDLERNTLRIDIADSLINPGSDSWRVFALAGYADPNTGESWPEGGAILDLAFVGNERPVLLQTARQADILAGTLSPSLAAATIDFTRAAAGDTELAVAPAGGFSTFLHHSRLTLAEGVRKANGTIAGQEYLGPYQPYLVWLPDPLPSPAPLHVFLHGASQNHLGDTWVNIDGWPYHGMTPGPVAGYAGNNKPVGIDPEDVYLPNDGAVGSIVHIEREFAPYNAPGVMIFPLGRMNSSGYAGIFEEDVLEAVADIRQRLPIDPDRISLSGSSMGGIGSFRLGALYPDMWSHVFPIVGDGSAVIELLGNLSNVPVRMHNGQFDPLVSQPGPTDTAEALAVEAVDYRYWLFETREHESLFVINHCVRDEAFAADRDFNPPRLRYTLRADLIDIDTDAGYRHTYDSAYWLSGLGLRSGVDAGFIEAVNLSRADRSIETTAIDRQVENITQGRDVCGPNPAVNTRDVWRETGLSVLPGADQAVSNALSLSISALEAVTLDVLDAGLSTDEALSLEIDSDGSLVLVLAGNWFEPVTLSVDDEVQGSLSPVNGELTITVLDGEHQYRLE